VITKIHEEFSRAIAKAVADKSSFLTAGKAESFERYKELAGEMRGLRVAEELFKNVLKRAGEIEGDE
jgi:hypothetical protein